MQFLVRNIWIIYAFVLGQSHIGESAFLRCYNGQATPRLLFIADYALIKMTQDGLNLTDVQLMGHSLGAHLMGYAGRHVRSRGYTISSSLDNYLVTALSEPILLASPSCLDLSLPTVFYTFGYRGKVDGPATTAVLNGFINTKKRNVVLVDWQEEAQTGVLGAQLSYAFYAAPNAKRIGIELGDALIKMTQDGLNLTDVQLMGHSLGAHLMGYAGRHVRSRGYTISRITGLDPARALFEGTFTALKGLDRTCARFVDITHTDPGGLGSDVAKGTVDFWPNFSRPKKVQPGCPVGHFDMFSREGLCSHDRSWMYYVESILNPTSFPAAKADDYDGWLTQKNTSMVIYFGDLVNTRAQGNFFFTTNASPKYARYEKGLVPDVNQDRRRRNILPRWLWYFR